MHKNSWWRRVAVLLSTSVLVTAAPLIPVAVAVDDTPGTVPNTLPFLQRAQAAETGGFGEFTRYVGRLGYSADGLGQAAPGGTVTAELPPGATVRQAFLYASYFGTTAPSEQARTLRFGGQDVTLGTIPSGAGSFLSAARADVTELVRATYATGTGRQDFRLDDDPPSLDGVALLVVYEDASLPVSTVAVVDGGAAQAGQRTVLRFSSPIDEDSPAFRARMSLGIGYGYQGASGHECGRVPQASLVMVNGAPLSGCAGGYDDGYAANGGLITVGGVDDKPNNPADPRQMPGDGQQPRVVDDELYDLGALVDDGDTELVVETANPSFDDILFLTVINVSARVSAVTSVPIEQSYGSGSGTHATNPSGLMADPVNTLSGSFVMGAVDLADHTPLAGLELGRFYNSVDGRAAAFGRGWSHNLGVQLVDEGDGAVVLIGEDGQRVRYDAGGGDSFIPPPGGRSVLTRTPTGYRLVRTDGASYTFDDRGLLATYVGPLGGRTTMHRDERGRLTRVQDQAGRTVSLAYDGDRVVTATTGDGRVVRYGYTGDLLTAVTDVRGGTSRYEYDGLGRLTTVTDARGNVDVINEYDEQGRVVAQLDALRARSTFEWDDSAESVTMTDALGRRHTDVYSDGVLVARTDGAGRTQRFERDEELRITAFTDTAGTRYEVDYDARGVVSTVRGPDGAAVSIRSDDTGRPLTISDPAAGLVRLTHDALGRLSSVEDAVGTTSFDRDATGLISGITDAGGESTTLARDATGAATSVTTPEGRRTELQYDAAGLLSVVVDARSGPSGDGTEHRSVIERDASGNPTRLIDPLGNAVDRSYDAVGNLRAVSDASGTTTYSYDSADRLTQVRAADGSTTSYGYDAIGNVVSRTDASGGVTTYEVDAANRLAAQRSPTGQRWTYTWDERDDLRVVERPTGTTRYTYDDSHRLVQVEHGDGTPGVSYTYDGAGRRSTMRDGEGTVHYSYDAAGRVSSVRRGDSTIAYTYDAVGRITSRTYPDGREVSYAWSPDGDLESVTDASGTTRYEHDAVGNLTRIAHANGTVETREHDRAGRRISSLLSRDGKVTSGERLQLDPNGNPLRIDEISAGGVTSRVRSFRYDDQDRLVAECAGAACPQGAGNAVVTYAYDQVGNRVREQRPGRTLEYRYDRSNQLVASTDGRTTTPYEHDAAGNLVRAGDVRHTYDVENRLVETFDSRTGKRTGYHRDGDGNVIRRTGDEAASLLWDPNAAVPLLAQESDSSGTTSYTWGHALLKVAVPRREAPLTVHTDRLGSVTGATDGAGQPVLSRQYSAFGERTQSAGPVDAQIRFAFAGGYAHPSSAQLDQHARAYDPTTGRFLQRDPLAAPMLDPSTSSYVYVGNRPTVLTDPSGMFCVFGRSSNGSCRGSGVASAVGGAASAAGDWVVDHRYVIGGVAVGAACIGAGVFTAGIATAACYGGAGLLVSAQIVEAGVKASTGPGFAYGQFFSDSGTAALLTWATMIPGLGISAQMLKTAGYTVGQRLVISTHVNLPTLFCAVFCPAVMVEQGRTRTFYGSGGSK